MGRNRAQRVMAPGFFGCFARGRGKRRVYWRRACIQSLLQTPLDSSLERVGENKRMMRSFFDEVEQRASHVSLPEQVDAV
ncbi:hypothetical protein PC129_g4439 [Phytophthora cactorum]|uniref:Uncharacterized protein n=1 Tax=Phytophthora cactorum TaxID=29920 RepID=A0A8T0ZJB5_9STRA|nr:hypothetical protein Pcac1_g5233 [Phytophthora cactorum]KAG2833377.1 hypothetical protein PC112_g6505 [Phytophthora cactorum]KAG2835855.1 hypothetical protein PC111_g5265 [Phytophthora cactorum]KAG2862011.1 hypothetical protein PC113_g6676 [Phytophthora cactorum]KAG2918811.1 hypothetical protein PC114_g6692 [Phytophthora cactorum]